MGFNGLKQFIYKADFFYTGQLLRYRGEPASRTILGGLLSIILIAALVITFFNKITGTFNMSIINNTENTIKYNQPINMLLQTYPISPFMFGVQVWRFDLNTGPRFFDIVMTNTYYNYGIPNVSMSQIIKMQQCTPQHWGSYPYLQKRYKQLNVSYWYCAPMNKSYQISGKYASVTSKTLDVAIKKCTNQSDTTRPCASQTDIDKFFNDNVNFYYTIYYINKYLNNDDKDNQKLYLEDANYAIFSSTEGEQIQFLVDNYLIQTDNSIFPIELYQKKTGFYTTKNPFKNRYKINPNDPIYSTFFFYKSSSQLQSRRNYQKIDEILSYIGGLFGTLVIMFFFVNTYNAYQIQISLAGYLFKNDFEIENKFKQYHFINFTLQLIYAFFRLFKVKLDWPDSKKYYQCRTEMLKQMDVLFILKRIMFLQRAITTVLEPYQLKAMHLQQKISFRQAKIFRKSFGIRKRIYSSLKGISKQNLSKILQKRNISQNMPKQSDDNQNKSYTELLKSLQRSSELNKTSIEISQKSQQDDQQKILKKYRKQLGNVTSSDSQSGQQNKQNKQEWMQQVVKIKRQRDSNNICLNIWKKLDPILLETINIFINEQLKVIEQQQNNNFVYNDQNQQKLMIRINKQNDVNTNIRNHINQLDEEEESHNNLRVSLKQSAITQRIPVRNRQKSKRLFIQDRTENNYQLQE